MVRWLVLGLVALLVAEAIATGLARAAVSRSQHELGSHLVPAQQWTQQLYRAFVDQETGQRGFLLTGDGRFLQPYSTGQAQAARLTRRLRSAVTDAPFQAALAAAALAGKRWQARAAEPEIAARRAGPIGSARLLGMALLGKHLFDQVRVRLDAVSKRADTLAAEQLDDITEAQRAANIVTIVVVVLALLVAVVAPLLLRRTLNRPLGALMRDMAAASADGHDSPIAASGPMELRVLAQAAEKMRSALVGSTRRAVEAERGLTLLDERDRMAADLHDHTIQQVFALGLTLSSAASKAPPAVQSSLQPLIDDTDQIIRQLRGIIFNIGHAAASHDLTVVAEKLTREATRALGFEPQFEASAQANYARPDVQEAAVAVLREMLSNVARHANATRAEVALSVRDGQLVVQVRDNGIGITTSAPHGNGLGNLHDRATRLGGHASVEPAQPAGTTATWRVPI